MKSDTEEEEEFLLKLAYYDLLDVYDSYDEETKKKVLDNYKRFGDASPNATYGRLITDKIFRMPNTPKKRKKDDAYRDRSTVCDKVADPTQETKE